MTKYITVASKTIAKIFCSHYFFFFNNDIVTNTYSWTFTVRKDWQHVNNYFNICNGPEKICEIVMFFFNKVVFALV